MKRVLIMLLLSIPFKQFSQEPADKVLQNVITKELAVGASAGYAINGKVVWASANGFANKEANIPFALDTKVRMASIAKPMTALAIMQLVELGKIDLDVPIQTYIPDYPKQENTQITTRHLLSHTSGIPAYKDVKEANTTEAYASLDDALVVFKDRNLLFEPGSRFSYTTYGYVVLGVLIERISGMPYETYMQKHIWDKAGMSNTGVDTFGVVLENESQLYSRKGGKKKPKLVKENNLSNRIPGGGLFTTVRDMLKFGNAVLQHQLVSKETLELMIKHHSLEKENNSYGFGWFLYGQKPNEGTVIGHTGAQRGCSSFLLMVPEKKAVAIVLANTSRVEVGATTNNLLRLALGKSVLD